MKASIFLVTGLLAGLILGYALKNSYQTTPSEGAEVQRSLGGTHATVPPKPTESKPTMSRAGGPETKKDTNSTKYRIAGALKARTLSARRKEISRIIEDLGTAELGSIISDLDQLGATAADRRFITTSVYQRWGTLNPSEAAQSAMGLTAQDRGAAIETVAGSWAELDPASALKWAETLKASDGRISGIARVLSVMAQLDPQAALSTLNNLTGTEKRVAGNAMYSTWAETDPQKAIESAVAGIRSGALGDWASDLVMKQWSSSDPLSALSWIAKIDKGSVGISQAGMLAAVTAATANDPESTVDMLRTGTFGGNVQLLRSSAAYAWMIQDPSAASAWISTQSADVQTQILVDATRVRGGAPPEQWLPLISSITAGPARDSAYQNVFEQWSATAPEAALDYLKQHGDAKLSAALFVPVLKGLAKSEPQIALDTALAMASGANREAAVSNVFATWALNNPAEASARTLSLPRGDEQTRMAQVAATTWAKSDSTAALAWAQSVSDPSIHDNALAAIANTLASRSPAMAAAAAQSISDPAFRQTVISRLGAKR